jgi:ABC-type multidrug transport system fused ATPase/permease subunit
MRYEDLIAAYERIRSTLDAAPSVAPPEAPVRPEAVRGDIRLESVTFAYAPGMPVLHDVTLEVRPGETVALVGPSGAGKSTLVKLILRFYDPEAGRVLLDGMDVRHLDPAWLRSQVGIVPQDTFLFGMSVEDNIACGRPEASDEEIRRAAALANADEVHRRAGGRLPIAGGRGGGHTPLGRAAAAAGHSQAFLRDPRILILGRGHSALDARAESRVQEALIRLMRGRTTNHHRPPPLHHPPRESHSRLAGGAHRGHRQPRGAGWPPVRSTRTSVARSWQVPRRLALSA